MVSSFSDDDLFATLKQISEIEPLLYLSGFQPTRDLEQLRAKNIKAVLTVADQLEPAFPDQFDYKIVKISDDATQDILQHFEDCHAFIDRHASRGSNVLVHCAAGVSRSAAVVASYLMKKHGISRDEALLRTRKQRPIIMPNEGFMDQLSRYEEKLKGLAS